MTFLNFNFSCSMVNLNITSSDRLINDHLSAARWTGLDFRLDLLGWRYVGNLGSKNASRRILLEQIDPIRARGRDWNILH